MDILCAKHKRTGYLNVGLRTAKDYCNYSFMFVEDTHAHAQAQAHARSTQTHTHTHAHMYSVPQMSDNIKMQRTLNFLFLR
jgi:hypothetical protein